LEIKLDNAASGAVEVLSGELRQDESTTTTNDGTFTVDATASPGFIVTAAGGQFINSGGTVANKAAITLADGASWSEQGGNETGNPVTMFSGDFTDSGSGTSGSFDLIDASTLSGTIGSGETVDVTALPGHNAILNLEGLTAVNHGTLILDSQSGGGYAELSNGSLTNDGTLDSQVESENPNYLEATLINNGKVKVKSGELRQDENTTTTNAGNVILDAAAQLDLTAGGDVFNQRPDGTMTFEIASATSFGTLNLSGGATFKLSGGTANPILASDYDPPVGTEYDVITGTWGTGTYTTVKHHFTGDYSHSTFLGLVWDG